MSESDVLAVPWLVSEILDDGRPAVITETNCIVVGLGKPRELCEHIVEAHNALLARVAEGGVGLDAAERRLMLRAVDYWLRNLSYVTGDTVPSMRALRAKLEPQS